MSNEMKLIEKQLIAEWQAMGIQRPHYSKNEIAAMEEKFNKINLEAKKLGIKTEYTSKDFEKIKIVSERIKGKIQIGMEKLLSNASASRQQFFNDPIEYFDLAEDIPADHRSTASSILKETITEAVNADNPICQVCIASVLGVMLAVIAVFAIVAAIAAAILTCPFWPVDPLVSVIAALVAAIAVLLISIGILELCRLITKSEDWQDLARKICQFSGRCQ